MTDDYNKAAQKAKCAEETSALESDEEVDMLQRRHHKPPTRLIEEMEQTADGRQFLMLVLV